jgi:hypothetical protein
LLYSTSSAESLLPSDEHPDSKNNVERTNVTLAGFITKV